MKKSLFKIYNIFIILVIALLFSSCEDDADEPIVPSISPEQSDFQVDYNAGEIKVLFESNVIFYATVDKDSEDWLNYQFTDLCKNLSITYSENDLDRERTGKITVSKGDVSEVLTITQAANPNAGQQPGGLEKVDLNFTISADGYTILSLADEEAAKIPIGATVVLECPGDDGTVSFINSATYAEYAGGSPVGSQFKFVWTQEMAGITAGSGIMAILRDGFDVTGMYCLYEKSNLEFDVNTSGYTILSVSSEISDAIPVGATVVIECGDAGTISLINSATYAEYAGGSPVNGKFTFKWTAEIAGITAGAGMMGILRDGFDVTSIYTIYVKTDLEFEVNTSGYTILSVSAEEAARIPIGATVVVESSGDAGTISFINSSTYAEYAGGAPTNGMFSFVWTKDIVEITRTEGMMAILRDGFDVSDMYCHN